MKPFRLSREGTLKGLLFFAVLANLSWAPLANHTNSVDLSSDKPLAGRPDCTGKDRTDSRCTAPSAAELNQGAADSEKARQAFEQARQTQGKVSAKPDQSSRTEAGSPDTCLECTIRQKDSVIDQQSKTIADLKAKLSTQTDSATTTTTPTDRTQPTAEQPKNCEADTDGDALDGIDMFNCEAKLLANLKSRDDSAERRDVTKKLQDLYTSLRKDARDDLFSKDADRQKDAEQTINVMLATLNHVHFDKDSERQKMIAGLQGLKAGAETRRTAQLYDDQVSDLEKDVKDFYKEANKLNRDYQASCQSRSGCDRDLYEQIQEKKDELAELNSTRSDLAQDIDDARENAFDKLDDYKDSVSRAELRDYTAPYNKLKTRIDNLSNPNKIGTSINADNTVGNDNRFNGSGQAFIEQNGLPDDFFKVRGGDVASRRGNGMYNSTTQSQFPVPPGMNQQVGLPGVSQQYGLPGQPTQYGVPQYGAQQYGVPQYGMQQQPYVPQYMQVPGAGSQQPLLPAPNGMANGAPMMPGQFPGSPYMTSGQMMPQGPMAPGTVIPVGGRPY